MKKIFALFMVVVLLAQFTLINYAIEDEDKIFEYTDGYCYLKNDSAVSEHSYSEVTEVYFDNCVIDSVDFLQNVSLEKITFLDCEFAVDNILLPGSLKEARFSNTDLKYLRCLKGLCLSLLEIEFVDIEDLSVLAGISTEELTLTNLRLSSLKGIEKVERLVSVKIIGTLVESIEPLAGLTGLKRLDLDTVAIESIEPIEKLNLDGLQISTCIFIKDIDIITRISSLKEVSLTNCEPIITQKTVDFINGLEYGQDYSQMLETRKQVEKIAEEYVSKGQTDDEKIELATHYVLSHLEYDFRAEEEDGGQLTLEYNNNGLKYALQGKGVCSVYAEFTAALLNFAGVKTYVVSNHNHRFNIVCKNDEYYLLDTTWMIGIEDVAEYELSENYMVPYDAAAFNESHAFFSWPSSLYNQVYNITISDEEKPTHSETVDNEVVAPDRSVIIVLSAVALIGASGIGLLIYVVKKKKTKLG